MSNSYFGFDRKIRKSFNGHFAGVDEAGRGPLAGPVVAAAVILPGKVCIRGVKDSKQINEKQREYIYKKIKEKALCIGIGIIDNKVIDSINILKATFQAMRIAIKGLSIKPGLILVDGKFKIPEVVTRQKAIVAGDGKSACIACASIIAKVTRDRIMRRLDRTFPQYGFKRHKGYGTKEHIRAIRQFGMCEIHRHTFCAKFV